MYILDTCFKEIETPTRRHRDFWREKMTTYSIQEYDDNLASLANLYPNLAQRDIEILNDIYFNEPLTDPQSRRYENLLDELYSDQH